jgi:hypothetical protein
MKIKFEGTVHLTSNFGYLMLLVVCACFHSPAAAGTYQASGGNHWTKLLLVDVPLFFAASVSISAFYFCAQRELHAQWWKRLLYLPVLMAVGVGLCINNARAVLEAMFNHHSEFIRTPKYGVTRRREFLARNKYRALRGLIPYIELSFGVYFSYVLVGAIDHKQWTLVPFVLIFQGGFLYVGLMSLLQSSWRAIRHPVPPELASAGA